MQIGSGDTAFTKDKPEIKDYSQYLFVLLSIKGDQVVATTFRFLILGFSFA
jgi:hypothetical protein